MRALNTNDAKDFEVKCGNTYNFKWVGNSSSSSTSQKHNKSGAWVFKLNDDCTIGSSVAGSISLTVSAISAVGLVVA